MLRNLLIVFALLVLTTTIILSKGLLRGRRPFETPSVDSLRTINAAQVVYARTHPDKGFAASLFELGPHPGDGLIDSGLASGRKSGYVFILSAAPPDSHGRIMHYTLVVRPEKYEQDSRSFFIDETGVKRFTTENRAPTTGDPPLN